MFQRITILFLINLLAFTSFILPMEESSSENLSEDEVYDESLDFNYVEFLPNELKDKIADLLIKDLVSPGDDLFEAHTKLSRSGILRNFFLVKNFRPMIPILNHAFIRLLNISNPYIHMSPEEINTRLASFIPENEVDAALAILAGGDVNLIIGVNPKSSILMESLRLGYKKLARFLIERGANVNYSNKEGYNPLIKAAQYSPELVRILLIAGANPNSALTVDGTTALMFAVNSGAIGAVKYLIEKGSNVSAHNIDNDTALKIARRNKFNIIKRLLKKAIKKEKAKKCLIS